MWNVPRLAGGQACQEHGPSPRKLQKACTGGDAESCYELGELYEDGLGVTKDERRAATLYEQACKGGEAQGCGLRGFSTRLAHCSGGTSQRPSTPSI